MRESAAQKEVPHRDFYNLRKVSGLRGIRGCKGEVVECGSGLGFRGSK